MSHPSPSAADPGVPHDVVAMVIGRAAELERAGSTVRTGLDEQAVVDIGREVGLTPTAVREALSEYHAGLLGADERERQTVVGPHTLVIERMVPGSIAQVDAQVSAVLERRLFDCCRRTGNRTVWRPRAGLIASLQRAGKRLGRDRPLDDVTEITVVLVELPATYGRPPSVRVRLEVECRSLRQGLVAATVGGILASGAGVLAVGGTALAIGDPLPLLGVPPLGALAVGSYVVPRGAYRRKLAEVDLILQGELDDLAG
jgi:hypothetical protein